MNYIMTNKQKTYIEQRYYILKLHAKEINRDDSLKGIHREETYTYKYICLSGYCNYLGGLPLLKTYDQEIEQLRGHTRTVFVGKLV